MATPLIPPLVFVIFCGASWGLPSGQLPSTRDEGRGPTMSEYEAWGNEFADSVAVVETGVHLRFRAEKRRLLAAAYVHVLAPLVEADGVGALLAWCKHQVRAAIALPHSLLLLAVPQPELKLSTPHMLRYRNGRLLVMRTGWIEIMENIAWDIDRDPWREIPS